MKLIFSSLLALASAASLGFAAPVKVVSFSSILTEVAQKVGGDDVVVEGIVKPGVDPHEFQPTPGDMKKVAGAHLVLVSGNGMEHYLDKLRSEVKGAMLVAVGDRLPQLTMKDEENDPSEADHDANGGTIVDPHWWHNVGNVIAATKIVRDSLIQLDPAGKKTFTANAAAYIGQLKALDLWIRKRIAELPRDQRKLVTSHDAFQYFAKAYGFEVHPIEGINHDQEPSAAEIAKLVDAIRAEHINAIFFEDTLNPKVSSELTRETGAEVGGSLTADGLGAGESSTYEGMMKHNINTIVDALKK